MKNFYFISDFDGTITNKDFYMHLLEKYYGEDGKRRLKHWQDGNYKDVDFLSYVFNNINRTEEELLEDILEINVDPYLKDFISFIRDKGGEFVILSAGASYYIHKILEHQGINDVTVHTNNAVYKNKGIYFENKCDDEYYCDIYGINKVKVTNSYKDKSNKLFFAGDSMPDYKASLLCDLRFATGKLITHFEDNKVEHIKFENFKDIKKHLENYLG